MGAQGSYHTRAKRIKGKQKAPHTAEPPEADLLQEGKAVIGYRLPHRHLVQVRVASSFLGVDVHPALSA